MGICVVVGVGQEPGTLLSQVVIGLEGEISSASQSAAVHVLVTGVVWLVETT